MTYMRVNLTLHLHEIYLLLLLLLLPLLFFFLMN
jgi:hypothetical protein